MPLAFDAFFDATSHSANKLLFGRIGTYSFETIFLELFKRVAIFF